MIHIATIQKKNVYLHIYTFVTTDNNIMNGVMSCVLVSIDQFCILQNHIHQAFTWSERKKNSTFVWFQNNVTDESVRCNIIMVL
mmetsp:Transcript_23037/g.33836  ORF Transcript_23037/g.33836 Transcript_23037/m.33836 type:complete len:84 (+) Transcript_23037:1463-1714(+)